MANEKRLIDANEVIRETESIIVFRKQHYMPTVEYEALLGYLKSRPTVDAVEVVHGEWVVCGDGECVPFMCSACGKTTSWYHAQTANYCPNCGAKMDGDGNDNA